MDVLWGKIFDCKNKPNSIQFELWHWFRRMYKPWMNFLFLVTTIFIKTKLQPNNFIPVASLWADVLWFTTLYFSVRSTYIVIVLIS